eukprot:34805_1
MSQQSQEESKHTQSEDQPQRTGSIHRRRSRGRAFIGRGRGRGRGRGGFRGRGRGSNADNYNNYNNYNPINYEQINDEDVGRYRDPNQTAWRDKRKEKNDAKYQSIKRNEQNKIDELLDNNTSHILSVKDKLNMRTYQNPMTKKLNKHYAKPVMNQFKN